jgi:hypothetical protein
VSGKEETICEMGFDIVVGVFPLGRMQLYRSTNSVAMPH